MNDDPHEMTIGQIMGDGASLETLLATMSHQEVARFKNSLDVDDPRLEVVLGWMEAHDIDD